MSATPMSGQLGVMKCRMVDSLACGANVSTTIQWLTRRE